MAIGRYHCAFSFFPVKKRLLPLCSFSLQIFTDPSSKCVRAIQEIGRLELRSQRGVGKRSTDPKFARVSDQGDIYWGFEVCRGATAGKDAMSEKTQG